MRGDVVRRFRRAAGILVQVWILLALEQCFRVRAEWLANERDVAAGRITLVADGHRRGRLTDFDLPMLESPHESLQRLLIGLCLRDHERRRPRVLTPGGHRA